MAVDQIVPFLNGLSILQEVLEYFFPDSGQVDSFCWRIYLEKGKRLIDEEAMRR